MRADCGAGGLAAPASPPGSRVNHSRAAGASQQKGTSRPTKSTNTYNFSQGSLNPFKGTF
jgi:hypothetical protein